VHAQSSARKLQAAVNGFESTVPHHFQGLPTDWADRFLVYSQPSPYSAAYESVQSSPRYWLGQIRRASMGKRAIATRPSSSRRTRPRKLLLSLGADWNTTLGAIGGKDGTVGAGMFPAKYTFNPIGAASCTNDFVVFNTSLPTTVAATQTGTFTAAPSAGETVTIVNGSNSITLTAHLSITDATRFRISSNLTTQAATLSQAIMFNTSTIGVSSTSSGATVTVTAKMMGTAGNGITLAETLSNFTWAGGTLAGGDEGQATIAAFNNLYPGCTGTVPSLYWAYNTAEAAYPSDLIKTSVVLSSDGAQVAFVETTDPGGSARLVVLKWHAGDGSSVDSAYDLSAVTTAANYRTCTAPCRTRVNFANVSSPNRHVDISSPFYDYTNDVLYVGDNGGQLRKFTGVFNGTPAEVIT